MPRLSKRPVPAGDSVWYGGGDDPGWVGSPAMVACSVRQGGLERVAQAGR
jgi:hypothetical protein